MSWKKNIPQSTIDIINESFIFTKDLTNDIVLYSDICKILHEKEIYSEKYISRVLRNNFCMPKNIKGKYYYRGLKLKDS